ncbi:carboxypeptidase regulatory-like domain-containing protein [Carboxylicivirga linearis]|uniref:Carboxypeptidase regulatory-like domain-containing protein n=1 Tax=Carboxylicivirga linearis TaxID=1628157 RepID=A0ABS5JWE2_9BACT|nr:carboxypeptidase regulatory-like domain-containing protein [Carboxylicivirga linearis]MBS2099173.1 carboxypeptidase regulatory-like domain-containing protein [Carboxylicivirga linearis]
MKKIASLILTITGICYGLYLAASPKISDGISDKITDNLSQFFIEDVKVTTAEPLTIPFFEDFNDAENFNAWTVNDVNTDAITWIHQPYGGWDESPSVAYSFGSNKGDDWLFSPTLQLEANKHYKLEFFTDFLYELQSFKVYVGASTDVADQTIEIIDIPQVLGDKYVDVMFTVPADGTYNLGFYCYSQHNPYSYLYIDNIRVSVAALIDAPAAVVDLTPVPGANGAVSMDLSWENPSVTYGGDALTEITSVDIYKDGATEPIVFTSNLTPGAAIVWNDADITSGEHTYKVVVNSAEGASLPVDINAFVGVDLPKGPETVEAVDNSGTISLNWSNPPALGMKEGWFDNSNITYRIVRQPGNLVLETNYSGNSYDDTSISSLANYKYEITSKNADGTGGTTSSKYLQVGKQVSLPFSEDFEDGSTMDLWTIINANEDEYAWKRNLIRGKGLPSCIGMETFFTGPTQDDWFISPSFNLEEGTLYRLCYDVKTNIYAGETWNVTIGKTNVPAAQVITLASYDNVSTGGMFYKDSLTFSAPYSGNFNLGFHLSSWQGDFTYFDNILLEKVFAQDIAVLSVKGNTAPTVGQATTNKVTIVNNGTDLIRNYTVQLVDADNNVLAESYNSRSLGIGIKRDFEFTWTPETEGYFPVKARVICESDEATGNNQSKLLDLEVQPDNMNVITIGEGKVVQNFIPIYPYNYTFSESVYQAELFNGFMGNINAIGYKVINGVENLNNEALQIFIGETDQTSLKNGWVPATEMQLVVDRRVEIPWGEFDWKLEFDQPYEYKGGNLVILVRNSGANNELGAFGLTFLASDAPSASSRYVNTYFKLDPYNPISTDGQFLSQVPNTMFYIDVENTGSLSGQVLAADGTTPLESASVHIDELNATVTTDADGYYEFAHVKPGAYSLTSSLLGYADQTNSVEVTNSNLTESDFSLTLLPVVTVSGKVEGNDLPGVGIANAEVKLRGYEYYTTVTDAEGNYTFENVYGGNTYEVEVEAPYYETYSEELTVSDASIDAHLISLVQEAAQALKVLGADRNTDALVRWDKAVYSFNLTKSTRYAYGIFGSNGSANYKVAHRYTTDEYEAYGIKQGMVIDKVRFYAHSIARFTIKIWQGDNGAELEVYSQEVVPELDAWNEVELDIPYVIDLSKNLLVGLDIVQNSGIAPITYDNGPNVVNGDAFYDGNQWTTGREITGGALNGNWNIEAICGANANDNPVVLNAAKLSSSKANTLEETVATEAANDSVDVSYFAKAINTESANVFATEAALENEKQPLGYNVYRLLNGQEADESSWVQLNTELITDTFFVDTNWQPLENDIYRFAVKSVYANDIISLPTFSNGVDKGKYAVVSAAVTTNGGSAEGAIVYLENNQFSYSGEVNADGTVQIPDVYFGTYNVRISKKGYVDYEQSDIIIDENTEDLGSFEILEDARAPRNVALTDYISSAEVRWEAPSDFANSWIHKDNGAFDNGIGLTSGGVMEVGVRYTSEELQEMSLGEGFAISRIRIFPATDGEYELKVWSGSLMYEEEIYSEAINVTPGEWNEFYLTTSVSIDNSKSYIIGYAVNHVAGNYPVGADIGPSVYGGDILKYGGNWFSFYEFTDGGFNLNWNIQAYCAYNGSATAPEVQLKKSTLYNNNTNTKPVLPNVDYRDVFAAGSNYQTSSLKVDEVPFAITYNVYRLAEADKETPANWTLLTDTPIAANSFTDNTWGDVAEGNYYYAVIAKYHNENYSVPEFSRVITKGAVSTVTFAISTNNGLSAENAAIVMTGTSDNTGIDYSLSADANGEAEQIEVPKGLFNISVQLEGFEPFELTNYKVDDDFEQINEVVLSEAVTIPLKVEATNSDVSATVNWLKPGSYMPEEGWMYWDNGEATNSIGSESGIVFSAAQRFTTDDLVNFKSKDLSITKVSFYFRSVDAAPSDADFQIRIWVGEQPELVYYQDVVDPVENAWNEVILDAPVFIDGTEEVWVGYECDDRTGYPAGVDAGPAVANKGALIFHEGEWYNLYDISNVNANWSIHAYCEEVSGTSSRPLGVVELQETKMKSSDFTPSLASQPIENGVSTHSDVKLENDDLRYVNGYQVWRLAQGDESNESAWTLLTVDAITETSYTDNEWSTLVDGEYLYAVKAVYESGNSEAAFSNVISTLTTGIDATENNEQISIYPIPNDGNFTMEVENPSGLTISNLKGGVVYEGQLVAGRNKISINVSSGVYIVQITNEKVNISRKIIIE